MFKKLNLKNQERVLVCNLGDDKEYPGTVVGKSFEHVFDSYIVKMDDKPFADTYEYDCIVMSEACLKRSVQWLEGQDAEYLITIIEEKGEYLGKGVSEKAGYFVGFKLDNQFFLCFCEGAEECITLVAKTSEAELNSMITV